MVQRSATTQQTELKNQEIKGKNVYLFFTVIVTNLKQNRRNGTLQCSVFTWPAHHKIVFCGNKAVHHRNKRKTTTVEAKHRQQIDFWRQFSAETVARSNDSYRENIHNIENIVVYRGRFCKIYMSITAIKTDAASGR